MIVQEVIYICIKLQFGSWCFNCSKFWLFLRDVMCGKLFCHGGSDYLPWKGRIATFLTCKLFAPEDSREEIGMVINGTKCGDKKVSWNCGFYSECSFCLFFVLFIVFSGPPCVSWSTIFKAMFMPFMYAWVCSSLQCDLMSTYYVLSTRMLNLGKFYCP